MTKEDLYMEQKFTGVNRNRFNTLYIDTKNIVLKNKELDIEIDMADKIEKISRIIIDGIIFEKKEN